MDLGILAQRRKGAKKEEKDCSDELIENGIARQIVDASVHVHKALGPGLLESVYETVLSYELKDRGLSVERQFPIPIRYGSLRFDEGFRADLLVDRKVVVELKLVQATLPVHKKQVVTYIRLGDFRLGLLINFGASLMKDGITRLVNKLGR